MLLTTGVIALSRKIKDERAKKQEAKQGLLNVGDSDVAKRAFSSQTTKMLEAGDTPKADMTRRGTEIKYEDPSDIVVDSPDTDSPTIYSPKPDIRDARHSSSEVNVTSPARSEKGLLEPSTPYDETQLTPSDGQSLSPPPYSPRSESSSAIGSSMYSRDTDAASLRSVDTNAISITSSNSQGGFAIRIKTVGDDLKSGFPYAPQLFDLKVHPEKWNAFTAQIVESTKLSMTDQAQAVAAATAVAMTGAIATSVFLGRSMKRAAQEKKVKAGLADTTTDGGLGEVLNGWNEDYFKHRGLFAHLELSESAMKNPGQKSKALRKSALLYSDKDERQRKREERKFVLVVTKLDSEGVPTEALKELELEERDSEHKTPTAVAGAVEIGSSEEPKGISELPGDENPAPVELPADDASPDKQSEPQIAYIEMDSDNTHLLEKLHMEESHELPSPDTQPTYEKLASQIRQNYDNADPFEAEQQEGAAVDSAEHHDSDLPPSEEPQQPAPLNIVGSEDEPPTQSQKRHVDPFADTQHETIPEPLNAEPNHKGVALYDGGEWGDDWHS